MRGLRGRVSSILGRLRQVVTLGLKQASGEWKDEFLFTDLFDSREWDLWTSRRQRYALQWAFAENSAYARSHPWTLQLRQLMGIYAHTRNIFSPCHQLIEWHALHLLGGMLDPAAGDGDAQPSALPITTKNQAVRPGIASVWQASNLAVIKSIIPRFGASTGDAGIVLEDDPASQTISFYPVNPTTVKYIDKDRRGNVKAYQFEEVRPDPEWYDIGLAVIPPYAIYTEECELLPNGAGVEYRTYRNGEPFDWNVYDEGEAPIGPVWRRPYPFVPFVPIQHINVRQNWGLSEMHALLSQVVEVDDVGSCTTDQVRRMLNGPWAINTKRPSDLTDKKQRPIPSDYDAINQNATQGRDRVEFKWIDKTDLKIQHMVGNMPLGDVSEHTRMLLERIYNEYPELGIENLSHADSSGRAIRILRQRAEAKAFERRVPYDEALVRAQRMALAMGRMGGYPAFSALPEGVTFDGPELEHSIGKRPVFAVDPLDDLEEETAFWNAAVAATTAGMPLDLFLKHNGWSEEDIQEVIKRQDQLNQQALDRQRQSGMLPGGNPRKPGSSTSTITPPTNLETQPRRAGAFGNPSKPRDQRSLPGPANGKAVGSAPGGEP